MEKVTFIVEQICGSFKDVKYKVVLERECVIPLSEIGNMMFSLHRLFDSMRHRVIVKIDNQFDVTDI